jgi:signal transduction histidine kinase
LNVVEDSTNNIQGENSEQLQKGWDDLIGVSDDQTNLLEDRLGEDIGKLSYNISRERLGLLLSCHLAELHNGEIAIQGSPESGYRYVVSLPLKFATSSAQNY